ncbi:hypothetical protein DFR50_10621 [Roseiarcus fermentans]|uniref:Uncharacterized protein n=1 Tax=Roseiarcus fermentans TaxID=1473586 RepID=A0A366FPU2_9HYPH|nr:hypothetical protein [Roseiarcus fermentans]RBP16060.1 hypothetical protein DFR50_10621 [Roseiarcus fermentans]
MAREDATFLVLNGSHLKKMATAEEIAAAVGVASDVAAECLAAAVERGWAMNLEGKYLVVPDGTAQVHRSYAELYEPLRREGALPAWYARFEALNDQFIKAVSDWQKSDGDAKAEAKILKIAERLIKAIRDIVPTIPRYENYVRRFASGVARVDRGERDYVCGPTIDSVHTVWFEFHEDILSVLGRPRDV